MALTNIEYGSLASSETMNNNFTYLDNRISSSNETLTTAISSILSNIATINSRITELSGTVSDGLDTIDDKVEEYKTKIKQLVGKACMLPNWDESSEITLTSDTAYTALKNGYIGIVPTLGSAGNIVINDVTCLLKRRETTYDNAAEMVMIPVSEGDEIKTNVAQIKVYFIPAKEVTVESL